VSTGSIPSLWQILQKKDRPNVPCFFFPMGSKIWYFEIMKKAYLVPNIFTAFSLACGLFVIFKINMLEPGAGDYEVVHTSALLLLVAAFADFMDGALARAIHAESEFGFVFDSMADAVSFGVAPSVLMLKALSLEQGTFLSFFSATGAMVFSLCGVLRLVRFNVKVKEAKGNVELQAAQKKHFTGLPIPAAAIAAISANLLLLTPIVRQSIDLSQPTRAISLTCVMIVLGYLMVCRLRFPSLKVLHFKIPSFHLAFLMVVIAIFVLYGILYFFALILALVIWAYVLISLILSFIRMLLDKKNKTLIDFDPDPEEADDE
jgi:CDP-diacylglycerol--serine O-phosphatidyltransferase